jgi:hypothetical protein
VNAEELLWLEVACCEVRRYRRGGGFGDKLIEPAAQSCWPGPLVKVRHARTGRLWVDFGDRRQPRAVYDYNRLGSFSATISPSGWARSLSSNGVPMKKSLTICCGGPGSKATLTYDFRAVSSLPRLPRMLSHLADGHGGEENVQPLGDRRVRQHRVAKFLVRHLGRHCQLDDRHHFPSLYSECRESEDAIVHCD